MKNTNTSARLIAVMPRNAQHAYVNGYRFDNVDAFDISELVESIAPAAVMQRNARNDAILWVDVPAPVVETVTASAVETLRDATPAPVVGSIPIRKGDKPFNMDAAELLTRYGLTRHNAPAIVDHIGNDSDVSRKYTYRDASGAAYVQYRGAFLHIPESAIKPAPAPVTRKQVAPAPVAPVTRKQAKKRFAWVAFTDGGRVVVRKLHKDGTVKHNGQNVPVATLPDVSRHYTQDAAKRRATSAKQARKSVAKATRKVVRKDAKARECKHILQEYAGAIVDATHADMQTCDTVKAWRVVRECVDELRAQGCAVWRVTYDRKFAWFETASGAAFAAAWHFADGQTRWVKNGKHAGMRYVNLAC